MIKSTFGFTRFRRTTSAILCLAAVSLISPLWAKPVPENLGYGLDKLVASDLAIKAGLGKKAQLFNGYATEAAALTAEAAISAADGRFMVDITLTGKVSLSEMRDALAKASPSFEVTSVDASYRNVGIIEGWVATEDATALAQTHGVRAVFLALKPQLNGARQPGPVTARKEAPPPPNFAMVGTKFLQGVTQHRVDKINQFYNPAAPVNFDGTGTTVGVLSDSFNRRATNTATNPNYQTNLNNNDQPGGPNSPINPTQVVVLEDTVDANSDEGRGMTEIVYKMAPKAKIGFATAFMGEVSFANNIRALSGLFPGVPNTQPSFKADVIVDDVSYGGEPVFADGGVVMNGVDDVTAVGVSYFSSAGNSYGVSVYNSDLRMIANGSGMTAGTNTALVGTNVDLTGVPPGLYQGGFHNFNPNAQDVACTWNISNGAAIEIQWDDPYDTSDPVLNQPPIYTNSGNIVDATPVVFNDLPPLNAGTRYVISEMATGSPQVDGIVSIIDPNGVTIVDQDTGIDEVVTFFPPASGTYTVSVRRFGTTTGTFSLTVNTASGMPLLSSDFNVLAFRVDNGAYVPGGSLTSNNYANNRPVELGTVARPTGVTQLQFVIARSRAPIGPRAATRVRLGTDANSNANNAPAEYFDYNSAVTKGHSIAAGTNGVGAYDVFKPNVPQNFTSGGPAMIFFNRDQTLKPTPEVRLQPRLAAANGSNSTWTGGDSGNDVDTGNGQFYGTSAAAPHAAAVAALVLQAKGGPGSVTPLQMRSILQGTTFPHDLDPYQAVGVARTSNGGKVTVTIRSDNTAVQSRGRNDPNSFSVSYIGPSTISTLVFNPNGIAAEGGGVTSGQNGVDVNNDYFSNITPGLYFAITGTGGFAFTQGASSGIAAANVAVPVLSAPAPLPAPAGNGRTLTLSFLNSDFAGGDVFRFTIGRGLERGPNVSVTGSALAHYNADLFGGGVLIPEGTVLPDGMRFSGTLSDGATFSGVIRNRIGAGFSQLDGFGFVNAEAAVSAPLP